MKDKTSDRGKKRPEETRDDNQDSEPGRNLPSKPRI
jgi:hypothetical protein